MNEENRPTEILKQDSWTNLFTGLGVRSRDKGTNTTYGTAPILDRTLLTEIFRGDGFAKRVVNIPVGDMIREWITIDGDTDNLALQMLEGIHAKRSFETALRWASLYGGSIIVMIIDDGQELDQPVQEDKIRNVVNLQVYDRWDVTWSTNELYDDPQNPKFGNPEVYTVQNLTTGNMFKIHETRVLRFDGEEIPEISKAQNNGWNDSRLVAVYERLRDLGETYPAIKNIIIEFIKNILKIENLSQLLSSKEGTQKIRDRLQIMDMSRHILNTTLIGEGEEHTQINTTVTGMDNLTEVLKDGLTSCSGIPRIKLFGEQSKGLGGEAQGTIRLYYDDIAARQENEMLDNLNTLINYLMRSSEGLFNGTPLDPWAVIFNPLWQLTEKEQEEVKLTTAKRDEVYIATGVVTSDEIRASRFGGDTYSSETIIEGE